MPALTHAGYNYPALNTEQEGYSNGELMINAVAQCHQPVDLGIKGSSGRIDHGLVLFCCSHDKLSGLTMSQAM
jgi:hypothetical protein